jgi:cytochrome c oxidase subunit 2
MPISPHRRRILASLARAAILAAILSPAGASGAEPRVVEISARRFEFTPAEVVLRKDETVTLRLRSADVTHGFFQRALGIDLEIEPGKVTEVTLTPRTPGRYSTICDHFCGSGHGNMRMTFVVQ